MTIFRDILANQLLDAFDKHSSTVTPDPTLSETEQRFYKSLKESQKKAYKKIINELDDLYKKRQKLFLDFMIGIIQNSGSIDLPKYEKPKPDERNRCPNRIYFD